MPKATPGRSEEKERSTAWSGRSPGPREATADADGQGEGVIEDLGERDKRRCIGVTSITCDRPSLSTAMFSYVFSSGPSPLAPLSPLADTWYTASSYFHLPIEEDDALLDDDFISPSAKRISWRPSNPSQSDPSTSSFPPSSPAFGPSKPREGPSTPNRTVINDILAQEDCYAVLGLSRAPRIDKLTLRRAYLARSKACHPECVSSQSPRFYPHNTPPHPK